MPSVREQIAAAVLTALNAPEGKPCTFYRTRVDVFNAPELPGGVVYVLNDDVSDRSGSVNLHNARIRVEVIVAGEAPADSLIDPIYVYVVNTLMADEPLGEKLKKLQEVRTQFESEASYQDSTMAFIEFEAVFATRTDPTVVFD